MLRAVRFAGFCVLFFGLKATSSSENLRRDPSSQRPRRVAGPQALGQLSERYGLELRPESVPDLLQRFGLQLGQPLGGGWRP